MTTDDRSPIVNTELPVVDEGSPWSSDATGSACNTDGHCVTCSDEALPARVVHVDQVMGWAVVAVNGTTAEVDVTLVDEVRTGQLLLVHGGVAIASLED